jgi:cytochrome P450
MSVLDQSIGDQVAALFAGDPELIADPYPVYARMREQSPIHFLDDTLALVTPHATARFVYHNHARFPNPEERGSVGKNKLSLLSDEERGFYAEFIEFQRSYMSRMNGETHRRVRSAGQRAFTPRRLAELEAAVGRITEDLLDELTGQESFDFIEFAYRLPLLVIMEMMGAPYEDAPLLKRLGDAINSTEAYTPLPPETLRECYGAMGEYAEYVHTLIERHRSAPDRSTQLVGALLDASQGDKLTEQELVGTYVLLLFAGHETTANLFGNGLVALMDHRDQWERLCADRGLAASATEELLRYDAPTQFFMKRAAADEELLGVRIPAGTTLHLGNAAANRDPLAFENPEDLDIARRPNDHLSLGKGAHFCLGAPVARMEGRIVFGALTRRFPDLELAVPRDELAWKRHVVLRGLTSLPIHPGDDRG